MEYCEKAAVPCKWTAVLYGIPTPWELVVYRKSHLKTLWMMHWKSDLLGVMLHQREGWSWLSNRYFLSLIIRLGQGMKGTPQQTKNILEDTIKAFFYTTIQDFSWSLQSRCLSRSTLNSVLSACPRFQQRGPWLNPHILYQSLGNFRLITFPSLQGFTCHSLCQYNLGLSKAKITGYFLSTH